MMNDNEIVEVVWLENPFNFDYVREGDRGTTLRNGGPAKCGRKIIGFENHVKKGKGIQVYYRRFWWLNKWDKDCEEPHKPYQTGALRPSEAVSPKDIVIPEGVRILKAYEIPQVVPEYRGWKGMDADNERCETTGTPPFRIIKSIKYAYADYDLLVVDSRLLEEPHKELLRIVDNFVKTVINSGYGDIVFPNGSTYWSIGPISGRTPRMRIYETRILAGLMKEIIMDKAGREPY